MSGDQSTGKSPGTPERQPIFLVPGVVTAVIGLMVAIHVASTFIFHQDALLTFREWFAFLPARVLFTAEDPNILWPLIWTPFTHAFLHAGWDHLLINSAWFAIFATPVARRYGAVTTLVIFLVSAAGGAALFAATTLPHVQILLGASGGVSGLTGAAVRFIFQPVVIGVDRSTGERVVLGRRLATFRQLFAEKRARYFVIVWIALNAAVPLLPLLTGTDVQIAWQAHLGGFIAGILLVGLFERRS